MAADETPQNIEPAKQKVVVYPGNFEPFHKKHFEVYTTLVNKFGKENVYLVTGDLEEGERAQLIFEDKKMVMEKIFDIDPEHIEEVENAYIPEELLRHFDSKTTAYIIFLDKKDAIKLIPTRYFEEYKDESPLDPFKIHGYVLYEDVKPLRVGNQDLTDEQLTSILQSDKTKDETKYKILEAIFPKQDQSVSSLFIGKQDKNRSSDPKTSVSQDKETPTKKDKDTPEPDKASKETGELKGDKNKPIMQRLIKNPESDRYIKIQSALKYPRWKPVYKMATQVLKVAGIDRTDRVKEPEVNTRYKKRAAKLNKEEFTHELTQQLTEHLMNVISEDGLTVYIEGYGTIHLMDDIK